MGTLRVCGRAGGGGLAIIDMELNVRAQRWDFYEFIHPGPWNVQKQQENFFLMPYHI